MSVTRRLLSLTASAIPTRADACTVTCAKVNSAKPAVPGSVAQRPEHRRVRSPTLFRARLTSLTVSPNSTMPNSFSPTAAREPCREKRQKALLLRLPRSSQLVWA